MALAYQRHDEGVGTETAWGAFAPKGAMKALLNTTLNLPMTWAGKRTFYALRRIGRLALGRRPVDVIRFGARMRLHADRNVCEGRILFNPNYFDRKEREFLKEILPEDPVFIDAGANIGGYSFYVCDIRPKAQVVSIEAQDNTFQKLFFNARQNSHMRVHALNCALSDAEGTIRLFINDTNNGETSIRVPEGSRRVVDVQAATLLKVANDLKLKRIDAIKLDIEGAEDVVIGSFFKTAPASLFPTLILIENSQKRWGFNMIDFLGGFNYRKIRDFGGNIVLQRQASA
jgi:FkbM family methyltransferase